MAFAYETRNHTAADCGMEEERVLRPGDARKDVTCSLTSSTPQTNGGAGRIIEESCQLEDEHETPFTRIDRSYYAELYSLSTFVFIALSAAPHFPIRKLPSYLHHSHNGASPSPSQEHTFRRHLDHHEPERC